jgi:hypothetical protein
VPPSGSPGEHPFFCPRCRAYLRESRPCPLCGSSVLAASAAPIVVVQPLDALLTAGSLPHRVLLGLGLAAVALSLAWALAVNVVWDTRLAILGTGVCALASLAMAVPWRRLHPRAAGSVTYEGDQPVVRSSGAMIVNPALTSTSGVALNPASATFVRQGFVTPFVLFGVVLVIPFVCAFVQGPAHGPRWVATGIAWLGFGLLWYRYLRREVEADGFASKGVPL